MHASQITSFLFAFNQEDYSSRTITNERIDLIKKEKKVSKFCGQFSAPFFFFSPTFRTATTLEPSNNFERETSIEPPL